MSDDVFENALVAAQEQNRQDAFEPATERLKNQRAIEPMGNHSDPGDEDDKVRHAFGGALPPPRVKWQIGDVFVPAPGDEDNKVRAFADPVVLKSYKLPLPQIDERIARSLGWVSPEDYNRRVTELLNANNNLVERRRIAEQRQRDAEALIRSLRDFLSDPVRAVLLAEIERLVSGT